LPSPFVSAHTRPPARLPEQPPAVEREAEPVGPVEVVREHGRRPRIGPDAEDALKGKLLRPGHAEELGAAIGRIAEVDAAVGRAHDVIGAIELLAVPVGGERLGRAVGESDRDVAGRVLAGEQAPPTIPREPVRLVARLTKRRDPIGRGPSAQMVARHVAPEQVATARVPERSFREQAVARDLLEGHIRANDTGQTGVSNLEARHAARQLLVVIEFASGGEEGSTAPPEYAS
jgi:hypothetical protein